MGWMVQGNWEKPPSDFDTTAWMLEHTTLVNKERESLEGTGYVVHTENQNLFRLRGTTATIAGKPDLIGEKTNEILISDAKTGHRSPSHRAQVHIYQYAVPKALTQFQGKQARGQVRYPDSYVGSPATSVTPDFVANLGSLIRRLAADVPARRGGRLVRHARRMVFQLAEVLVTREMLTGILERISRLRLAPG